MSQTNELELSRFAEYLLKHKLVREAHAKFHVFWVRRFLQRPPDPGLSLGDRIALFLESLQSDGKEDWQVEQAEKALRLYFHNFQKERAWQSVEPTALVPDAAGRYACSAIESALRERLRIRHYAYRTEQTYCNWVGRYIQYALDISPPGESDSGVQVTAELVKNFIGRMATQGHVAASTQNQALNALLFLCREVLGVDLGELQQGVRAKQGKRLPTVLSVPEVQVLLKAINPKHKLMAELIYGGGLRVSDACRLRVKDIDFDHNLLFVRSGKGDKDRTTLLAESAKPALRKHLEYVRAQHEQDRKAGVGPVYLPDALARKYPKAGVEWGWCWVFPSPNLSTDPRAGVVRRHHLTDNVIQKAVRDAAKAVSISKPVSVHTLRHSFATHLLLNGVDIRQIQDFLGHANVETTMVYTHVVKDLRNPARSPLDVLWAEVKERT